MVLHSHYSKRSCLLKVIAGDLQIRRRRRVQEENLTYSFFLFFFSHFLKNGYPGPQVLFTFLFRKVNTVTVILLKEVAPSPGRIMF